VDLEGNGVPDCLEEACLVADETLNQGAVNTTPWAGDATALSLSPIAQEFVPEQTTLRAIRFWLYDLDPSLPNDPMRIIVYQDSLAGLEIARSVDVTPFDDVFTSGMVRFDFPTDVDITPGTRYIFELVVPNGRAGPSHWDASNPDPAGNGFILGGAQVGIYTGTGVYDFGFETISAREGLTRGGDTDQDSICDDIDQCPGEDDTIDLDENGGPDCAEDPCLYLGGDSDGDGSCDDGEEKDLCPDMYNIDNTDTNGDGIGDVCQCGDVTHDVRIKTDDVTQIWFGYVGIWGATRPDNNWERCDVSGDGKCNLDDAIAVWFRYLGRPAGAFAPGTRWVCGDDSAPPLGAPVP